MKTALFALFLLSVLSSHLPSATAGLVYDIDGEPILNGGTYYILPVIRGKGGGLELDSTGNESCPLTVVQSPAEVSEGRPLRLSSPLLILFIGTGLPLKIAFTEVPNCAPTPSNWNVVEEQPEGWSVKITGYENAVEAGFTIEEYESDYKLALICSLSIDICGDLGIYIDDDGKRRLVLSKEDPLKVKFKKHSSISAA